MLWSYLFLFFLKIYFFSRYRQRSEGDSLLRLVPPMAPPNPVRVGLSLVGYRSYTVLFIFPDRAYSRVAKNNAGTDTNFPIACEEPINEISEQQLSVIHGKKLSDCVYLRWRHCFGKKLHYSRYSFLRKIFLGYLWHIYEILLQYFWHIFRIF